MTVRVKLSLLLLVLSALIIVALASLTSLSLEEYFQLRIRQELRTQSRQTEYLLKTLSDSSLNNYIFLSAYVRSASIRLTLIDSTGLVLFESEVPKDSLSSIENH